MAKQVFRDGTEVVGFYARTIKSGQFVFVSGTTSLDARGRVQGKDVAQQTLITMRKIEAGLRSAGATLRDLTRLTIFVTDIRDMGAVAKALSKALKGSVGMKVNLSPTGTPNEYDLLVVRDAMVINPDPESERERGEEVATRVMREVCSVKGLQPQVIDHRLVQQINFYVRFRCA